MNQALLNYKVAKYFPLANGKYEVSPGLFSLGHDFGNSKQDRLIFQFDQKFSLYRKNKVNARNEQLNKYFCSSDFSGIQQQTISRYIISTLCTEYPEFFHLEVKKNNLQLNCSLTEENIFFSDTYELTETTSFFNYRSLFDAICMQIPEDIAIISENSHVSCLHLMAPNFWSATDKIAKTFNEIHQPVAGFDKIAKSTKTIIQAMINKGPYVRFAWGLTSDSELNHYPDSTHYGRDFNDKSPSLFLRVERQTISGLPEIQSAIFTIRSYLYNVEDLNTEEIQCVISAVHSMTEQQLEYKGLRVAQSAILMWLSSLI